MFWADIELPKDQSLYWYIGGGVLGLAILVILLKNIFGTKAPDLESGMGEKLGEYPPPPAATSSRRLTLNGMIVRIRLVVLAPVGKQHADLAPDQVPEILDDLFRGIPAVLKADKPRIKIWPPQLSVAGFAPTFHRLVKTPDAGAAKSKWVLVAGPIKAGGKPALLGMALLAEEANKLGTLTLEGQEWVETMRIERS